MIHHSQGNSTCEGLERIVNGDDLNEDALREPIDEVPLMRRLELLS